MKRLDLIGQRECAANARFIAAAPELLDIIKNIAAIDDGWLKAAHPNLLRKAIRDIRNEACAAIARAEGR